MIKLLLKKQNFWHHNIKLKKKIDSKIIDLKQKFLNTQQLMNAKRRVKNFF